MNIITFGISFLVGVVVGSFFLVQVMILLFFGIPFTKKLQRSGMMSGSGPMTSYLVSVVLLSSLFVLVTWGVGHFFESGMVSTGYWFGVGWSVLMGVGRVGENPTNKQEYFVNNAKYIDQEILEDWKLSGNSEYIEQERMKEIRMSLGTERTDGRVGEQYGGHEVDVVGVGKKEDGLYEEYYENGQLRIRGTYKDGRFDGLYEFFYQNGLPSSQWTYKDGEYDGPFETYYENGQLESKGTHKDGQLHGPYEWYYENGQPKELGNYKDGVQIGPSEFY